MPASSNTFGHFDRRRFLGLTGTAAAGLALGVNLPSAGASVRSGLVRSQPEPVSGAQRTLIVVEMEGGNDALNTFVPTSGTYYDARPTLALPENELLTFDRLDYGVNPALADLAPLWEAGNIAALYGVGLPDQSRSHFVAQDAWRSGLPGQPATSGWIGRWLEATEPVDGVPLRAVSLGPRTLAAEGESGRPVAVQSVAGYRLAPPRGRQEVLNAMVAMSDLPGAGLLGDVQSAIPAAVESAGLLQQLIAEANEGAGEAAIELAPDPTSSLFAAAAAIVKADVGTQVLYITVPGFDTHANQGARHDERIGTVARGLRSLFDSLGKTGHSDRTLAIVVSEFGRRVEENASLGTDHGGGGLALAVGPAVVGKQVIGEADINNLVDGDLATTVDTRSLYAAALTWLGSSDSVTRRVLPGDWDVVGLLR